MTNLSSASLIISISIFFSVFIITPSHGVSHQTLATICSQTQNQEICEGILRSDPRTDSADLPLLSLISIEITEKQANNSLDIFTSLSNNATIDPSIRTAYEKCVTLYNAIVEELGSSYELSKQKKYEDVVEVGPTTENAYTCENGHPFDPVTGGTTVDMLLALETFRSVASFVADSFK